MELGNNPDNNWAASPFQHRVHLADHKSKGSPLPSPRKNVPKSSVKEASGRCFKIPGVNLGKAE
jgi:hypothetical protein